ncbi:MAG: hypothetical protein WCM76_05020 [Bacteroidota bacterium]
MKTIFLIFSLLVSNNFCNAQKDYSAYYKITCEFYNNTLDPAKIDYAIKNISLLESAFEIIDPLPSDLMNASYYYYILNNRRKGRKYLLQAAKAGAIILKSEDAYMDSVLNSDKKLRRKYDNFHHHYLTTKCDVENSIEIIKLFNMDQHTRSLFSDYSDADSSFYKYKWKDVVKSDSTNYFSLLKILKSPNFNSRNLTSEAQLGLGIVLMHSATERYANKDTVFAQLKKEMLNGAISPRFYANSVDRYYMYIKSQNYYCCFYDEELPIFDLQNIDKRRAEVWLYPLYLKFKWNNQLDMLPKDYKYDPDSVK